MNLVLAVRPVGVNPLFTIVKHNIAGTHLKSAQPKQAALVLQVQVVVSIIGISRNK